MSSNVASQTNLPPEEVLDIALHHMQNEGIELVEWNILLHLRMNVPRILSVIHTALLSHSLPLMSVLL